MLAAALPDDCIVSVEGALAAIRFHRLRQCGAALRVDWHRRRLARGIRSVRRRAAIPVPDHFACDGRRASTTIQALWNIAREQLPVVILIAANHRCAILQNELRRFGMTELDPQALSLTVLDRPRVDWKALAAAAALPARTVHQCRTAARRRPMPPRCGPCLIRGWHCEGVDDAINLTCCRRPGIPQPGRLFIGGALSADAASGRRMRWKTLPRKKRWKSRAATSAMWMRPLAPPAPHSQRGLGGSSLGNAACCCFAWRTCSTSTAKSWRN